MNSTRSRGGKAVRTLLLAMAGFWLLCGLSLALGLWYLNGHPARPLNVGDAAPAFALRGEDGRPHKLGDYRGRPVALAFLPDLGADSLVEIRSIQRSIRQFDTLGIKVFGIAPVDRLAAKAVHDAERLSYPLLLDPGGVIARAYGADGLESAEGRVSYVLNGDARVLLPVSAVNMVDHGRQLVELTECCLDRTPRAPSKLIGKPVADFSLPRVSDGKQETLYGGRKPEATVLFVLSAECPCSAGYDSRITGLARLYGPKGVRFLAINASANEKPAEIAERARNARYPFHVVKDAGNRIADRLDAQVTPETFVMDRKGVLAYHGRIDDSRDPAMVQSHDLSNALDFVLAGQKPTRADVRTFGCAIYREPR
jgi:peroxiredoxin